MKGLSPEDEMERLEALRRYHILDTPPDRAFDHIAELAAGLFRVPIAMVCLVDNDRIWFKSHYGIETQQVAREDGLCASVILSPEVYHIRDAIHDARAQANPLVAGSFRRAFLRGCSVAHLRRFQSGHALRCRPSTPRTSRRPKHRCSRSWRR